MAGHIINSQDCFSPSRYDFFVFGTCRLSVAAPVKALDELWFVDAPNERDALPKVGEAGQPTVSAAGVHWNVGAHHRDLQRNKSFDYEFLQGATSAILQADFKMSCSSLSHLVKGLCGTPEVRREGHLICLVRRRHGCQFNVGLRYLVHLCNNLFPAPRTPSHASDLNK